MSVLTKLAKTKMNKMKYIETKYDLHDEVYFLVDSKIYKGEITEIVVNFWGIQYHVRHHLPEYFSEDQLYSSLEELKDSLLGDPLLSYKVHEFKP